MASTDTIRTVVGIIGNVISLLLFLSPSPTFVNIVKKKDVQQFSPLPYLCSLANCVLWVEYGLPIVKPGSTLVITINGAGVVIQFVYIVIFVTYSPAKEKIKLILITVAELIVTIVLGVLIISLIDTKHKRATIIGIICIVFNILMYAAPLGVMKMVIQTKSVEFMPIYLSLASLANGACWTIYSLLKFDINILVPNGVGLALTVVQIILYAAYYSSTQKILAARNKGEIGMTNVRGGEGNKVGSSAV